ncbi:MAG: hypothetical protein ACXVEI_13010 [Actinomycetota bacterium]
MSVTRFLVLTAMYIVVFGGVSGGLAAWAMRAGSSPLRDLVSAFRTRAGSSR